MPEAYEIEAFVLERNSAFVIDKVSFFCDKDSQECQFYDKNGKALFYDELHLTVEGLNFYGKKFANSLCKIDPLFCI